MEKIYSEERFIMARDYLENFKNLYPSGYFTLVKVTQKDDYGMFELMEENKDTMSSSIDKFLEPDFNSSYSGDINTILHELTHIGPSAFFSILMEKGLQAKYGSEYYMIGNLIILIEKDKMLFSKTEVFQDIENPDDYDVLYLSPYEFNSNEIDLINILDELNTYTGGVKCGVASESLISYGHSRSLRWGLLKQMSHLELYLKRCYEKYPEDWEYITEHKGLAFMVMKLWQEAEKFENIVKDDSRFNMDSEPVSEFVYNPNNYKIIEKFFDDSEIMSYRDETFPQACEELDGIKIYDINS
ncbi:MAG: hypothetical protein MUO59_01285 [Actinobacteria bacterium]|nr:hypothetical protein [Actinomycetota bacterium]